MNKNGLKGLIDTFERHIHDFILSNGQFVKFTHPQYAFNEVSAGEYEILLSITGLGTQHFHLKIVDDEFAIRGKMVEKPTKLEFPHNIMSDLVTGTVLEWFNI